MSLLIRKGYKGSVVALLLLLSVFLTVVFLVLISPVAAQANSQISIQGKVVNLTDGTNIEQGSPACVLAGADTCDIRANIYDQAAGGTLLWSEDHDDIELGDRAGIFNLALNQFCASWASPAAAGSCNGGSGIDWGTDPTLFIEIEFDDDGNGDFVSAEVFSRSEFTSVPFAYYADSAGSVIGGLDTVYDNDSNQQLDVDNANGLGFNSSVAGDIYFDLQSTGDFVIRDNGTDFFTVDDTGGIFVELDAVDNPTFNITNLGTGNSFIVNDEAADASPFVIDNDGNVGIGTTTPGDTLEVIGNGSFSTNLEIGVGSSSAFTLDGGDLFVSDTLEVDGLVDFAANVDFNSNEAIAFRTENADGNVSIPTCDAANAGRHYYDTFDDNAYVCVEQAPTVYGWFDYTASITSTSTKVVTVGTGGDYASIAAAASYLNGLTGGIILLTPENHNVTSVINLDQITLIGANTSDTVIDITGGGSLQVKETQFKSLTIDIAAGLTAGSGLDVIYDAATTSSIIFEWVRFEIGGFKYLIDSTEATAPIIRTRFISTYSGTGNGWIIPDVSSSNIDPTSNHFIESQGGQGALNFQDWDVQISGSGNVITSGTHTTIPNDTIYVYPGMNIQAAIDSLPTGGFITLLPGVHSIDDTLLIDNDGIQITGYGDSSVLNASGFAGITDTTAAIHVGAEDGTAPVDDVQLRDFKLEVEANTIHGIRVAGGTDNQVDNLTVQKMSGTSGSGATAKIGIFFIDGTATALTRPVIINCRVLGNGGTAFFTDGIHVSGGASYGFAGIWTNGTGITNALVDGNNVDYVSETAALFIGVDDSSLYNNRFSRMGAGGGGGPIGVFIGNSSNVNASSNVVTGSVSTGTTAFVVESLNTGSLKTVSDSIFTSNTIDGEGLGGVGFAEGFNIGNATNTDVSRNIFQNNIVRGAATGTTEAIDIQGNADDNSFVNNTLIGGTNAWDTGVNLASATSERNIFRNNKTVNVTTPITDNGTATTLGVVQHQATSNPTINDDIGDGYGVGTIWIDTAADESFILVDSTAGAAIWNQIDGGGGGGPASPGYYGEIYSFDTALATGLGTTWATELIFTTAGDSSGTTLNTTTDSITVQNDGIYEIEATLSFSAGNNRIVDAAIGVNGSVQNDTGARVMMNGGDEQSMSLTGIFDLTANDVITVMMQSDAGTTASVQFASLNVRSATGGSSGGSGDLDDAYTNDTDKVLDVDDALGLEFESTTSGDIVFDLQSTGDFEIQDAGGVVFTVQDDGNVGIGTTGATQPLDILSNAGGGDQNGVVRVTTGVDRVAFQIENADSAASTTPIFRIQGDNTADDAFVTIVSGDTFSRFATTVTGLLEWGSGSGAADTNLYRSGANLLATDDSFQIGTNLILASAGSAGAPALYFSGSTTTGIYQSAADQVAISAAGTEQVRVTANGLRFAGKNADPGSPQEGDIWFRSDTDNFKVYADGRVQELVTAAVIQVYESGTTTIPTTSAPIDFDGTDASARIIDPTFSHSTGVNPSEITINDAGLYRISYSISWDTTANARRINQCEMLVGGSPLPTGVSVSYDYSRNNTDDKGTNSTTFLYEFSGGDVAEISCDSVGSAGSVDTVAGESWLTIELVRRN